MDGEHVVVADDDPADVPILAASLETQGYRVTHARTGEEILTLLAKRTPELVILALVRPVSDGYEAYRLIREVSDVPMIMLVPGGAAEHIVTGLRLGADDCVSVPSTAQEFQELLARIEAVLHRAHRTESIPRQAILKVGDIEVDRPRKRASLRGRELTLAPSEYRLLSCLAAHADTALTHDQLLGAAYGPTYHGQRELLRTTVWRLRRKLEENPSNPRYIVTRPGQGYMLVTAA